MVRPLIIINKAAAKAQRAWPIVQSNLNSAGLEFDVYETKQPRDATVHTRDALRSGVDCIAVVGGDGTLSEVAEGFFEIEENLHEPPIQINAAASLAILPAGTGDDFARGLMGRRASLIEWLNIFVAYCHSRTEEHTRLIDVLYGRCNSYTQPFICLNASTMGIGGETAARVAAQGKFIRQFSGELRFAAAATVSLARWRERRVRVSINEDSEIIEGQMNLAAVVNSVYAGGGMMLSPEASIDDGQLDVVIASGLTRPAVLRELARIHKGGHVLNPRVKIRQAHSVRIETFSSNDAMPIEVDGNVRGGTPVEYRVLPKALKFVVGERVRQE